MTNLLKFSMTHASVRSGLTGFIVSFLLVLCCSVTAAYAQFDRPGGGQTGTVGSGSGGSFYDYSGGAGVVMDVNVWGFVRNPGKYRVPSSTKLIQLISFAGGPADRALLAEVKILHDLTIDSTITDPVEIYDIEKYQETGEVDLNPILYPNDTVIIPGDSINSFTEVLGIVRDVILVVGTIFGMYIATQR